MRKISIRTVLITAALSLLFAVSAYADSAVVTGSDVNVRSGPGVGYPVIDCLAKNTEVTVNDCSNSDWFSITVGDTTGFMSSAYIKINGSEQSAPAQQQEQPSSSTSTSATINAMYVRFRSGPGTGYAILGEYNTGTPVTITGSSNGWYEVIINNQAGFIYGDYITEGTHTVAEQPAATPTPTEAPVITPAPTPEVTVSEQKTGTISGNYVRFRSGPDTSYDILGTYNKGKALTVTGTSGSWTAVIIDNQAGFVYSQYVSVSDQTSALSATPTVEQQTSAVTTEQKAGYIKGNNVRFRSGPGTSYDILGEYSFGKELTITGTSGEWTAVVIDSKAGFVCSTYVKEGTIEIPSSNNTDLGTQIANFALQFVGYNYVWGGTSPSEGFDCSGLVYYTYKNFSYTLHRVADDIAKKDGAEVTGDLQPGDILCFFSGSDYCGHVGIYIGNGKFVHASSSTTGVIITELTGYYDTRGYVAKRIV